MLFRFCVNIRENYVISVIFISLITDDECLLDWQSCMYFSNTNSANPITGLLWSNISWPPVAAAGEQAAHFLPAAPAAANRYPRCHYLHVLSSHSFSKFPLSNRGASTGRTCGDEHQQPCLLTQMQLCVLLLTPAKLGRGDRPSWKAGRTGRSYETVQPDGETEPGGEGKRRERIQRKRAEL